MNSTLHSVLRLVQLHYPHLQKEQTEEEPQKVQQKRKRSGYKDCAPSSGLSDRELVSVDKEHENLVKNDETMINPKLSGVDSESTPVTCQSHDQPPRPCDANDSTDCEDASQTDPDFITVAYQVLDFISPSVNDIHLKATHPDVLFPGQKSTIPQNVCLSFFIIDICCSTCTMQRFTIGAHYCRHTSHD